MLILAMLFVASDTFIHSTASIPRAHADNPLQHIIILLQDTPGAMPAELMIMVRWTNFAPTPRPGKTG